MTIILDFDDVLFDTKRFKRCLAKIFKKYGTDFYGTYDNARGKNDVYSFKKHLILVKKENRKINIKKIEEDINKIDFNQFLFPDALGFLKTFKKNHDIILLSWGDKDFQKRKIYGLGKKFTSLFDRIVTGPVEKGKVLKKILRLYKSRPVVFIDNSLQELKKIKNTFKDIILIRVERDKRKTPV